MSKGIFLIYYVRDDISGKNIFHMFSDKSLASDAFILGIIHIKIPLIYPENTIISLETNKSRHKSLF